MGESFGTIHIFHFSRSCGKVMFSRVCVCPDGVCGQGDGSGRYLSYWNVFLLVSNFVIS